MELSELEALCTEWQGILRMRDWKFSISLDEDGSRLPKSDVANVEHQANSQVAEIKLLSTRKYAEGERIMGGYDQETALVHEMVHTKFYMLEGDDPAIEFAIDSIAEALVNLRRK